MWWRMTKTIIISWVLGAVCGALMILALQRDQTPTAGMHAGSEPPSQTIGSENASPNGDTR
jgi:hypothetical protein